MNERVARELVKTRQAVKRKYKTLKADIAESQIRKEKEFKPLTEPLQELLKTIKSEPKIKKEPLSPSSFSSPIGNKIKRRMTNTYQKYLPMELPSFLQDDEVYEDDVFSDNAPRLSSTIRSQSEESTITEPTIEETHQNIFELTQTPAYAEYLEAYHPLVRAFVDSSLKSERQLDHTHGLYLNSESDKWQIGDSLVDFDKENLKVKNVTYKGTPGLYELLFFQDPKGYSKDDLDKYMDILKRTNTYRRNYDENEQVQGTNDPKYVTIIKPYLAKKNIIRPSSISSTYSSASSSSRPKPPTTRPRSTRLASKKGGSMLNLSNKKIDYVYYDDFNELVERLKLLVSSQMAGHTGHQNEIVSILEELREAKIIK